VHEEFFERFFSFFFVRRVNRQLLVCFTCEHLLFPPKHRYRRRRYTIWAAKAAKIQLWLTN